MIICSHSNIDIIHGVIDYGDIEGITDWRISNTNTGILNILNSTSTNAKVSILENGNVGIGTNNPASILDIIGDINITGIYKKNNRDVINETSNYVLSSSNILIPRILTDVGNGSNYVSRLITAINTRIDNTSNYVLSTSNLFANSVSNSQWTNVLQGVYYNTSNVGIGATSPITKLHIYDDTTNTTKLTIQNIFTVLTGLPTLITVTGATGGLIGTVYRSISFTYTSDSSGLTGQTLYTFTPTEDIICDILLVGGGGGGGQFGGGGGGGAILLATDITLSNNSSVSIKVGKGGTGAAQSGGSNGTNGANSSITILSTEYIATGGGGGGTRDSNTRGQTGNAGGSGGGGSHSNDTAYQGMGGISNKNSYSSFQSFGNSGGKGRPTYGGSAPDHASGGGGGAGSVGSDFSYSTGGGNGGSGKEFISYFGSSVGHSGWFSGGGGGNTYAGAGNGGYGNGGNGLLGGGGQGGHDNNNSAVAGLANTGGGGGGGRYGAPISGGNGGSGFVIIRYRRSTRTISIELISGNSIDASIDYKIGNYGGDFKIISSVSSGDTDYIRITSSGASIYGPTGSPQWSTISDRRIKENIEKASYDKCYDNINKLELYRFNYIAELKNINKDLKQLGYIAQEVQDIFPKAVSMQEFCNDNLSIPDMLSIDIAQINYSLYGAVKKLIEMYNDIEDNINILENILNIDNTSSNVNYASSNIAIDYTSSNVNYASSNVNYSSSNVNYISSNVNYISSNVNYTSSNIIIDTNNVNYASSNVNYASSNVNYASSNVNYASSNVNYASSNIAIEDTSMLI